MERRNEQLMAVEGIRAHRVYQRNAANEADIPFRLAFAEKVSGRVEVEVRSGQMQAGRAVFPGVQGQEEEQEQELAQGQELAQIPGQWQELVYGYERAVAEPVENSYLYEGVIRQVPAGVAWLRIRLVDNGQREAASVVIGPIYVGDLWVLAGQSNMEGCGKLVDIEQPQAGVSCLYMDEQWGMAEEPLSWLNESPDSAYWLVPEEGRARAIAEARAFRTEAAGLGIAFAKELAAHTGVPVGLIPCARGATDMDWWAPTADPQGPQRLYHAMLRRIRLAGGKVKGLLWYQGESDAIMRQSHSYMPKMLAFAQALRRDLDDANLPIIYAQLSVFYIWDHSGASHWNHIQQQQLELEPMLAPAAMVPTLDAALANPIHLDARSLRTVGRRMAWQAARLAEGKFLCDSGPRLASWEWNAARTELRILLAGVNGTLEPVGKVYGFCVEAMGRPLHVAAELCDGGQHVRLRFEQEVPADSVLWHGAGLSPTVNIRDGRGMPLVMFGPVTI